MLKEMGVEYVILGHSERRTYFGDTDETVAKRLKAALENGLKGILCVGEYKEQREQALPPSFVAMQVKIALGGLSAEQVKMSLSHMSPFGQSEQVSPPPPSRPTRFAELSAPPSPLFTARKSPTA